MAKSWLCSVPLFFEYESVLTRPDIALRSGLAGHDILRLLEDLAHLVAPVGIAFNYRPALEDPADETMLEAAMNGGASTILTSTYSAAKVFAEADGVSLNQWLATAAAEKMAAKKAAASYFADHGAGGSAERFKETLACAWYSGGVREEDEVE